jgi:hypothetical protein
MKYLLLFIVITILVLASANKKNTLTFYTRITYGTDGLFESNYYINGSGSPGSNFIARTNVYTNSNRTGTSFGQISIVCTNLIGPVESICNTVLTFYDDSGAINMQGYFIQVGSQPFINYFTIIAGTRDYEGITGELIVNETHVELPGDVYASDYVLTMNANRNYFK